jgi:Trp operon repressor
MSISSDPFLAELVKVFRSTSSDQEMADLLASILTPEELMQIKKRWQIVKMLLEGETQRTIAQKLQISTAKVGRGSRELKYGNGIFPKLLSKLTNSNPDK